MRFQSVTQLFAALVLALSAMSCSKSNTQTVTINFPDWKQLQAATYAQQAQSSSPSASATLENAGIISVSVGNRVIQGFPWEHKSSQPNPPTNVTFEVENGSLVQAMAILETAGGARAYYYGDAKVTQSGALDIELSNVLTTTAGEGKIIGRYITGTDSSGKPVGPTGVYQYRFDIASLRADLADRPSMVVTTGEIFNGWMSVTTLAETALKYTKLDGSPIFQASEIDVATVAVGTTRAARVVVPAGYKNENSGSTYDMRESPRKQYLLGYFGPSADAYALSVPGGLNLCYESVSSFGAAPSIDRLYRQLNASGSTSDMPQGQMVWGGEFPGLSFAEKLITARLAAGGIVKTSSACTDSAFAFNQALTIDSRNLSSDDEFMGFRGPFTKLASGRFVASTYSSANQKVTVNWSLLPGVPSVLSGVSVFYRSLASGWNDDDAIKTMDGYDCQSMRDRARGFEVFREIQSTSSTAEITGIPNQTEADKLQIIACPRAIDGSVYKSAVKVENNIGGGGGAPGPTVATEMRATSANGGQTAVSDRRAHESGNCIAVHISATDSMGRQAAVQNQNTVTVSTADSSIYFFNNETCNGAAAQSIFPIPNFNGSAVVFFKDASSTQRSLDFSVTAHASMNLTPTTYFGKQMTPAASRKLRFNFPAQIYAQQCTPVIVTVDDGSPDRVLRGWTDTSVPIYFDTAGGLSNILARTIHPAWVA